MSLHGEVRELTIARFHNLLRNHDVTVREVTTTYLQRIEALDRNGPTLNTIVEVSSKVLKEAEDLDAEFAKTGTFRGPLHGVPVIVKDQIETAGLRTTFGNIRAKDNVPDEDATAVALLKDAGALVLAKSTLPDFARSFFSSSSISGLTKNPYALDRDAGGSSGGSAAAIAANLGLVALGEDTGGSIRLPASFNNVVGLRPTVGLVSTAGVSSMRVGTDTVGPIARTVEDVARLLDVLAKPDDRDRLTALAEGHRRSRSGSYLEAAMTRAQRTKIALVTSLLPNTGPDAAAIRHVVTRALVALRDAAIEVIEIDLPDLLDRVRLGGATPSLDDTDAFIKSRPGITANSLREIYEAGDYHELVTGIARSVERSQTPSTPEEQLSAERARQVLREYVADVLATGQLDALVYPDVRALPPLHAEVASGKVDTADFPTNTGIGSALRFPAISVPIGFTDNELPVGLELLGLPFGDGPLLRVAAHLESVLRARRHPLP